MVTDIIMMCCDIALGIGCFYFANDNAAKGRLQWAYWEGIIGALDFFTAGALFSRIITA